jgi:HEAT repeat protein
LRRNLKAITRALDQQSDDVRSAVLRALGDGPQK